MGLKEKAWSIGRGLQVTINSCGAGMQVKCRNSRIDTDTQYAFTRPIVEHMFKNYDGVLKIESEVGNKKMYDPRSYLKKAEDAMKERIIVACSDLRSEGNTLGI